MHCYFTHKAQKASGGALFTYHVYLLLVIVDRDTMSTDSADIPTFDGHMADTEVS